MKILDSAAVGWARERRADVAIAEPARRIRVDLVAPGHARDPLAGEQDDVQDGGSDTDQRFDPTLQGELTSGAIRHGARL